jgi:hypothetical protein
MTVSQPSTSPPPTDPFVAAQNRRLKWVAALLAIPMTVVPTVIATVGWLFGGQPLDLFRSAFAVGVGVALVLAVPLSTLPRVTTALGLPRPIDGDERERKIMTSADQAGYLVALVGLLVGYIGLRIWFCLYLAIAVNVTYYAVLVYRSRRL